MLVALQLVGAAGVPLNVSVLDPCVAAKFPPLTVIGAPTAPVVGERLAISRGPYNPGHSDTGLIGIRTRSDAGCVELPDPLTV